MDTVRLDEVPVLITVSGVVAGGGDATFDFVEQVDPEPVDVLALVLQALPGATAT